MRSLTRKVRVKKLWIHLSLYPILLKEIKNFHDTVISQHFSPFEYHNKINVRQRFEFMQNSRTFLNMIYYLHFD